MASYASAAGDYGNPPSFHQVPAPPAPAAPAAPAAASPSDGDPLTRLQRLGELRAQGVITEAEFQEHKRRLLGEV
jgi:hypothetical protein